MDEVIVTVTILDVDGDDLEEEADEFDLNEGDDEKVTLELLGTRPAYYLPLPSLYQLA